MCRWMAWHGQPMLLEDLLFRPKHGLIDQSLHSRMGAETTNGDGFGVGWYGEGDGPGAYRSTQPAWGDANLRHLAGHVRSPLFLAHVRATTGTAIQQSNCHPFHHERWLFVHNGLVAGFRDLRRELMLELDPARFPDVMGSTDSEVLFHLALTYGLAEDPVLALERVLGLVEERAARHGIADVLQASIGVSDGERLWAVRYATTGTPRTLFVSADVDAVRRLHPEAENLALLHEGDRLVVSEPLADLSGAWHELRPGSALVVDPDGALHHRRFHPEAPGEHGWEPL